MTTSAKNTKKKAAPKKKSNSLTDKQRLFVREYLKDMNATHAYLRAGYKVAENVAAASATRLLRNVKVSAMLQKSLGKRLNKLEITNDAVLQEIAKMAFSNMRDFIDIQPDGTAKVNLANMTREQAAAIQEMSYEEGVGTADGEVDRKQVVRKVKFKLAEKIRSLELLGKYLKLFNDGTPVKNVQVAKVLKDAMENKIPVREAAYKLNALGLPLPEVLKIELAKQEPTAPPDGAEAVTNEELERRYQEQMAAIEDQKNRMVPERREQVAEIKKELEDKEMFAEDDE